jgi:hypothetical protein
LDDRGNFMNANSRLLSIRWILPVALLALLLAMPAAQAQLTEMGGGRPPMEDKNVIGEPLEPDEIRDDDEVGGRSVLDCDITKVTTALDSAIPTVTFWGESCEMPLSYSCSAPAFVDELDKNACSAIVFVSLERSIREQGRPETRSKTTQRSWPAPRCPGAGLTRLESGAGRSTKNRPAPFKLG